MDTYMMQQLYKRINKEEGAFLPLMIFGIIALLGLAGLSLDAANLYYAKIQHQKAVDVGVIAGLEYRLLNGAMPEEYTGTDWEKQKAYNFKIAVQGNDIATTNILYNLKSIGTDEYGKGDVLNYGTTASGGKKWSNFKLIKENSSRQGKEVLEVNSIVNINLLLLDVVPFEMLGLGGISKSWAIESTAIGELKPTYASLLLDFSTSMQCPAAPSDPDDPCPCLADDSCSPLSGGTKMQGLIDGVYAFLQNFKPGKDRVSIIPFNSTATVFKSMKDPLTQADIDFWNVNSLSAHIDDSSFTENLQLGEWTNPSDGFLTAYLDNLNFQKTLGDPNIGKTIFKSYYTIFSDGAPTAGRFLLNANNRSNHLWNNRTLEGDVTENRWPYSFDYTLLSTALPPIIEYTNPDPSKPKIEVASIFRERWGPTAFLRSKKSTGGWPNRYFGISYGDDRYNNIINNGDWLNNPACSQHPSKESEFRRFYVPDDDTKKCYNNHTPAGSTDFADRLNYNYPAGSMWGGLYNTITSDSYIDPNNPGVTVNTINQDFIKMFYDVTVAYSDFIRMRGGTIYAIGFGPPDADTSSAYQNMHDGISRKDYFMQRLAYDTENIPTDEYGHDLNFNTLSNDGRRGIRDWKTLESMDEDSGAIKGEYLATQNSSELADIFSSIAKNILRLTN